MKVHNTTYSIASVKDGTRAENDFSIFDNLRIDGYDVLQITASEDGVIHSDPICNDQYTVGRKTPDHRTASCLLAFLYEHVGRLAQHVRRGLRVAQDIVPKIDFQDAIGYLISFLLPLIE